VRVRTGYGEAVVLHDMPRRPGADKDAHEGDRPAGHESERARPGEDQVGGTQQETEGQAQPPRYVEVAQSASSRSTLRAITIR
jgi:hypothetical protein